MCAGAHKIVQLIAVAILLRLTHAKRSNLWHFVDFQRMANTHTLTHTIGEAGRLRRASPHPISPSRGTANTRESVTRARACKVIIIYRVYLSLAWQRLRTKTLHIASALLHGTQQQQRRAGNASPLNGSRSSSSRVHVRYEIFFVAKKLCFAICRYTTKWISPSFCP